MSEMNVFQQDADADSGASERCAPHAEASHGTPAAGHRAAGLEVTPVAFPLSAALALVAVAAATPTALMNGILRGPAVMNGSARGTAVVMLVLGVPVLVGATLMARRGSGRGLLVWLGTLGYLLYNAVMLLFATPFNHLFLLYVAVASLSLWSVIALLHDLNVAAFAERFDARLPVRRIAAYAWTMGGINALVWLKGVVPGILTSGEPDFLKGTGLNTFPTYVQDLTFWMPLIGMAAWWLWQRASWGYLLVGALLVMGVLESVGVAVDQWWGHTADPASTVASAAGLPLFATLACVGMIPVTVLLRHLDPTPHPATGPPLTPNGDRRRRCQR